MRGRLVALVLAVLFAAQPGGCGPGGVEPNGGRPEQSTAISFHFRVTGISGRLYNRAVQMTITSIREDGTPGEIDYEDTTVDPPTRAIIQTPYIIPRIDTPVRVSIRPVPGVVAVDVKAVYLGHGGDFLICWVERNGLQLDRSYNRKQVPTGPGGRGEQEVSCEYLGPWS